MTISEIFKVKNLFHSFSQKVNCRNQKSVGLILLGALTSLTFLFLCDLSHRSDYDETLAQMYVKFFHFEITQT